MKPAGQEGQEGPAERSGRPIESALDAIRARLGSMSDAERKIADYVLAEPKKTLHYNVAELSKQGGASRAAVVRFCKRIGAGGFAEFKLRLARDVFQDRDERYLPDLELQSEVAADQTIREIVEQSRSSLAALAEVLDPRLVEAAVESLRCATLVALFGVGASGVVASDFHQKLLRIGMPATYCADAHAQIAAACSLRPTDLAFVFSYSGESGAMVEVARQARFRGARIATVTMDGASAVRSLSDIPLIVPATERIYRLGAETSRIDQLAVVDVLFSLLVSRDLDSSIAAIERSMEATHGARQ